MLTLTKEESEAISWCGFKTSYAEVFGREDQKLAAAAWHRERLAKRRREAAPEVKP